MYIIFFSRPLGGCRVLGIMSRYCYLYDATDQRSVKLLPGGQQTTYLYLNGQPMAELDNFGNWTDYIYANGQKIAKTGSADTRLHFSGNNCASCGWPYRWFWYPPVPQGLTFQQGTKLAWRQYQSGTATPEGGIVLSTNAGATLNWGTLDQSGQPINSLATQGTWVQRVVDLSGYAGQSPTQIALGADAGGTGTGGWDIYMADIAFIQPNGAVFPLYNGQAASGWGQWGDQSVQGQTMASETVPLSSDPTSAGAWNTHYYVDDHLGTAQMELASSGWPVWQGQFMPFGGELPDGFTAMHYKFTGKERDTESGLDYFGARYYASNMGRWMSPDWAEKPEDVPYADLDNPQSLNLYGYVNNNPLSKADKDGHCAEDFCIVEGAATAYFAGAAVIAGTAAVLSTPAGQRSLQTFTSAAGDSFSSSFHGLTSLFSKASKAAPAPATDGDKTNTGPKAATAPGVTAGGQATDQYGNKIGPSGKPQVDQVDHSGKKGAKDAARNEGKGEPEKHPSPTKGDPHYHPTDANGEKAPNSTHHNYPN